MLKKLVAGTDYFAEVGDVVRVVAALALAPFAIFFALGAVLTPVAAVCIALGGDWRLAGIVLSSSLIVALLAIPLCWLTLRLFRGRRAASGVTVLPTWLVRIFLLAFLGPLSVGMAAGLFMWAFRAIVDGDWRMAVLWGVGACGFITSLVRAFPVAFRRGKRGGEDSAEPAAPDVTMKVKPRRSDDGTVGTVE